MFSLFKTQKSESSEKNTYAKSAEPNMSRRGLLKLGTAAGLSIASGKMWTDIFSDPNFRESFYAKIAEFANEKMMQSKLEKAVTEFETKYGIKLKLRSFDEINKDASEYNNTEQARLEIIKTIVSRAYEHEINKFAKGRILSEEEMATISHEYNAMVAEISQDYYNKNPGKVFNPKDVSSQLSTLDKYNFVFILTQILEVYPVSYIRSLGLEYIDAGSNSGRLNHENKFTPYNIGVANPGVSNGVEVGINRNVYLDYTPLPLDSPYKNQEMGNLALVVVHELSHAKDNKNTNDRQKDMLEKWELKSLDLGASSYLGENWLQVSKEINLIGFANTYGMSDPAEDRATIVEMFWANPKLLSERCKADIILAAKVKLLKEEFKKEHSAFDGTYWKMLEDNRVVDAGLYAAKIDRDLELEKRFGKK